MTLYQVITIIVVPGVALCGYVISLERRLTTIAADVKWIVKHINGIERG